MTEEVRQALRICPLGLRQAIDRLPDAGAMEELRLRCGQPPACRIAGKERALPLAPVTPELLRGILEQATQRSAYAMQEMTRCGFVTLPAGTASASAERPSCRTARSRPCASRLP